MPGRKYSATGGYRYGFNGKENDLNIGEGVQDYGMRIYNSHLGRFLSVDPLTREYPWNSTYGFAENDVLRSIDIEGAEKYIVTGLVWRSSGGQWLTNLTIVELKTPGPLGNGAVYHLNIDLVKYIGSVKTGEQYELVTYIPSADEHIAPTKTPLWKKFMTAVEGTANDNEGGGPGSNQKFGFIFKTDDSGMGSTRTGTKNGADNFEVIDDGLLNLIGGTGGSLSVIDLVGEKKRLIRQLTKGVDELKDGNANGTKTLEKILEPSPINSKPGATKLPRDTNVTMYSYPPNDPGHFSSDSPTVAEKWKAFKKREPKSKATIKTYEQKTTTTGPN